MIAPEIRIAGNAEPTIAAAAANIGQRDGKRAEGITLVRCGCGIVLSIYTTWSSISIAEAQAWPRGSKVVKRQQVDIDAIAAE